MLIVVILTVLLSVSLFMLVLKLSFDKRLSDLKLEIVYDFLEQEIEKSYLLGWEEGSVAAESIAEDGDTVRIAFYEGKAYWVSEDGLMCADADENMAFDYSEGMKVDTIKMEKQELDVILEILDTLKEGDSQ